MHRQSRAAETREQFYDKATNVAPMLAVDTRYGRFVVPTGDGTIGRGLFVNKKRADQTLLSRAVGFVQELMPGWQPHGRTFLDIGANIGTSTIAAVTAANFGAAVALEPERDNYRLLRLNALVNGADDRVRAFNVAVSDRVGDKVLAIHPRNTGGHHLAAKPAGISTASVFGVSVDWLCDRGVLDPSEVGLIWIDVQGHEGHVIAGAGALSTLGVPIVMEFHPGLLRRSRGWTKLKDRVSRSYTHFVDMRTDRLDDASVRPVSELPQFARVLHRSPAGRMTDILLIRNQDSV